MTALLTPEQIAPAYRALGSKTATAEQREVALGLINEHRDNLVRIYGLPDSEVVLHRGGTITLAAAKEAEPETRLLTEDELNDPHVQAYAPRTDRSQTHAMSVSMCIAWTVIGAVVLWMVGREIGEAVMRLLVENREVVGIAARTRGEFMGGL